MNHVLALAAVVTTTVPAVGLPPPALLSTGQPVSLAGRRVPERPTVFVFYRPSSSLERSFLDGLRKEAGAKVGFGLIRLTTGAEPVARQYAVTSTPTAIVYDRRGRLVARSSDAAAIQAAIRKAAGVMRIDWAEEGDPRLAEAIRIRGKEGPLPGILRTMSLKPEYMAPIHEAAQKAHFVDGFLKRRTKEMIATYVSALNHCKYWIGAHAYYLQLQGENPEDVDDIAEGQVQMVRLTKPERALLDYVKVLTLEPAKVRDTDVERLRRNGWTDEQIFEASYITALFAFFNRMADAYGLDYQPDRWLPPAMRPPVSTTAAVPHPAPPSATAAGGSPGGGDLPDKEVKRK